ncbi:MAG TPA: hypothetical protein VGH53_16890 [Streptosporangiaceae bacterium]|jgi:hypothetical protein
MSTRLSRPRNSLSRPAYWPVRSMRARDPGGLGGDVVAEHLAPPSVRPDQRGDDPDQGRLARALWPEQCRQSAAADHEVHALESGAFAECLDHAKPAGWPAHRPTT